MTLCIAALCQGPPKEPGGKPVQHLVASFDSRVETDIASTETEVKLDYLSDVWSVLFAGPTPEARELIAAYRALLSEEGPDDVPKMLIEPDLMRWPPDLSRHHLADSCTQRQAAMSYARYLKDGKKLLAAHMHQQIANEISMQRIGTELILIGFFASRFHVYRFDPQRHQFMQETNFAVIGSGYAIAGANMYQRNHSAQISLSDTLYMVYESQRLGANAPGVGQEFSMVVINFEDNELRWHLVSDAGKAWLSKYYRRFGPRKVERGAVANDLPGGFYHVSV
jgi:hypothetical protein